MTERSANVRVNVSGNAGAELAKIDNAVKRVGADSAQTATKVTQAGKSLDLAGKSAAGAATKVTQLTGSNARARTSLASVAKAADTAATGLKKAGNDAFGAAVKMRASANAIDQASRAVEGANRRSTNTAQYQRVLSVWERIAGAIRSAATSAGQFARTQGGRDIGGFLSRAGRFAGAVGSLAGTALDTARGAGGALGIASRDQLASQFVDNDIRIARLSAQAHWTDAQTAQNRSAMNEAARASRMDPAEIMSIVETGQNRFSDASGFLAAAPAIARFSQATGTNTADVTGLVGESFRQMGVRPDQISALLGTLQATSEAGSVEASDIAGSMSPSIGAFHALTGQGGIEGMQQFLGLAQVMGSSGGDAATLTQNLLAKLSSGDVQQRLRRGGINATDSSGRFDIQSMIQQIVSSDRFRNADGTLNQRAMQGVLGADMQANQAMLALFNAERGGTGIQSIAGASATAGNATIDTAMRRIEQSAGGGVLKARADAAVNFSENGDALVRQMTSMATAASRLDTRFPRLSADIDLARGAFSALTGTIGAMNLAAGANVAGSVAGGAGALGAAGGASGVGASVAAGTAAFAGTVALQDAIVGNRNGAGTASENVAQFFRNFGSWGATDDRATNRSGVAERVAAERQRVAAQAAAPATDDRALQAQQETNRHLRSIAGNTAGRGGEASAAPP